MATKPTPIGVFWDIENCPVPKGKSAFSLVQRIRDTFFYGHREAEFVCVCDTSKEQKLVLQELNSAQVSVMHVSATSKNAADDKLRQSLRRYADTYSSPAFVIAITSDINFAPDLSDLRHRKTFHVILLHNSHVNDALVACANEHYNYEELMNDLPSRSSPLKDSEKLDLTVMGLPSGLPYSKLKNRLNQLAANCGGQVDSLINEKAVLHFPTCQAAARAKKRMDGDDVFGSKIMVDFTVISSNSTLKTESANKAQGKVRTAKPQTGKRKQSEKSSKTEIKRHSPCSQKLSMLRSCYTPPASFMSRDVTKSAFELSNNYSVDQGTQTDSLSTNVFSFQQEVYLDQQLKANAFFSHNSSLDLSDCCQMKTKKFCSTSTIHQSSLPIKLENVFHRNRSPVQRPWSAPSMERNSGSSEDSVELLVTNLDYNISLREWKEILYCTFRSCVKVQSVIMKSEADNANVGVIKVSNIDDARFAISQFHRKKIGYKRIQVSLKTDADVNTVNTRSEVVALLDEVNGNVLPLFKFIELFEKRYRHSITVSELYKMRDTIEIYERGAGRMIHLIADLQRMLPPVELNKEQQESYEPVCLSHCHIDSAEYLKVLELTMLPNVRVHLKTFAAEIHLLLQKHYGSMPLMSFVSCFTAELHPLETLSEGGVFLEHLISCIPGVQISVNKAGVKKVQWAENKCLPATTVNTDFVARSANGSPTQSQLAQFSREVVNLLKLMPQCALPFNKFIPAYHHHFGRQCRVADYGYTKLVSLFEAIPNVLQILGTGEKKMLTLSHHTQVRRFTSDLLRVLKAQPTKQLCLADLPCAFSTEKLWDITEYGVCYIEDMLKEIMPSTVLVSNKDGAVVLMLPTREQTTTEIARMKQFSLEVVELLRHNPQYQMTFNKFIPSYHQHFGHQCRVANYGFTKLIELFEAIPHIIEIQEDGDDRILHLTEVVLLRVFAEQLVTLLKSQNGKKILLYDLKLAFDSYYDIPFAPENFNVGSMEEILAKLSHLFEVFADGDKKYVALKKTWRLASAHQVLNLMMEQCAGRLPLVELCSRYKTTFGKELSIQKIKNELFEYVQVTGDEDSAIITLTPLYEFAREARIILKSCVEMSVVDFERSFQQHFGIEIKPALYGFSTLASLFQAVPHLFIVSGKGNNRKVVLLEPVHDPVNPVKKDVLEEQHLLINRANNQTPSNDSGVTNTPDDELLINEVKRMSPVDLLAGPVPPGVPSPDLLPVEQTSDDLIRLHSPLELVLGLTDKEKRGQKTPLCSTPPPDQKLQLSKHCNNSTNWWKTSPEKAGSNSCCQVNGQKAKEKMTDNKKVNPIQLTRENSTKNTDHTHESTELSGRKHVNGNTTDSSFLQAGRDNSSKQLLDEQFMYENFSAFVPSETSSTSNTPAASPAKSKRKRRLAAKFTYDIE